MNLVLYKVNWQEQICQVCKEKKNRRHYNMIIRGYQRTTLVDFPGQVAAIIFTAGCNLRCGFCYNKSLVINDPSLPLYAEEEILEDLKNRKHLLDALVICGGEPTIHQDLPSFIKKVKALGYLVKLDTNGTNPEMIKQLLNEKLIDYIAMDIKAPLHHYLSITKVEVKKELLQESIRFILQAKVEHEFRTTLLKQFHTKEDIESMAKEITGGKKYYLQLCSKKGTLIDESFKTEEAWNPKVLQEMIERANEFVSTELRI